MPEQDIRWKQRFQNFDKALLRLHEAIEAQTREPQNRLYSVALVGTWQFTFELAWKTLKDYLNYQGVDVSLPREVIKQSFHHHLLDEGELWIKMMDQRNLMAHVYDEHKAEEAVVMIRKHFAPALAAVHLFLKTKL